MKSTYINHSDSYSLLKFCEALEKYICDSVDKNLIILCIGTDRCTGDSLGPLVGYMLKDLHMPDVSIYGTLDEPVHAGNLKNTINLINEKHDNPFIIAIDACLGSSEHIGYLCIKEGPLVPGAAMKKDLPPVGDVNITGIVNMCGFLDNLVLQSTRLSIVMAMSKLISGGLKYVLWQKQNSLKLQKAF